MAFGIVTKIQQLGKLGHDNYKTVATKHKEKPKKQEFKVPQCIWKGKKNTEKRNVAARSCRAQQYEATLSSEDFHVVASETKKKMESPTFALSFPAP